MTDSNVNKTPPTPPPAPGNKPSWGRRWWRRAKIALVALVLLLVAMRVAVYLLLPGAVRKAAAYYDLDAAFERQELKLLGGDATLWHLTLTPKTGGQPVLSTEYIRGDISVLSLLRGKLYVWRADADGVELLIERQPDGKIPWLQRLTATPAKAAQAKPAASAKQPTTRRVDLAPPFKMDALRLTHVRARVIDRSVTPPFNTEVAMDLRLSNVGSTNRPTRFEMDVSSPPVLDSLVVQGEGRATEGTVDAELTARVRGLRPRSAATYLEPAGITPEANEITGDFTGRLQVEARPEEANAVGLSLRLDGIKLAADGADALTVKHLVLSAPRLTPAQAVVDKLTIDGVTVNAGRTSDGFLQAAGLRLTPRPPSATATRPVARAPARVPTTQPATPFRANVDQVAIRNVRFIFDDKAVTPSAMLIFGVDQLLLKSIRFNPSAPPAPLVVDGSFHLPGVARAAKLTGNVQPFGVHRSAKVNLEVSGIKPDALAPYFHQFGLECPIRDGTATLAVDANAVQEPAGDLVVDADAENIQLRDGPGEPLAKLDRARVGKLRISPAGDRIAVQSVEVTGPATSVLRDKSGAIAAAGLRLLPNSTRPPTSKPASLEAGAPSTAPARPLPRIEVGHFLWSGTKVTLTDEAVTPPTAIAINDAGVELRDIVLDPNAGPASPGKPGQFRAWLVAPKVAKSLTAEGTLAPSPSGATIDWRFAGEALSLDPIDTYLRPMGIEPMLRSGSLRGRVRGHIASEDNGLTASARLDEFRYADGPTELLSVDSLVADRARLTAAEVRLPNVEINRLHASVVRDADETIVAAGVRLLPEKVPTRKNPTIIDHAVVKDAVFPWTDRTVRPAVSTTVHVDAEVKNITLHRLDPPGDIRATVKADGAVDELTVAGKVVPYEDAPAANVEVTARGVRVGPLASYLPPGIRPELKDGRLHALVDAALSPEKEGGQSVRFVASKVDYRDGDRGPTLLKLDSARVIVPRFDAAKRAMIADEVAVSGLETGARMGEDGRLKLLGVSLGPAAEAQPASAAVPPTPATTAPASQPALLDLKTAAAKRVLPMLSLKKLDVGVRRLDWVDERQAGAEPLAVTNLHLVNKAPVDWGGADAESKPPTPFQLTMGIEPLVRELATSFQVAPLVTEPSLAADLTAKGIQGANLLRVVPGLSGTVDASGVRDGEFRTHVEGHMRPDRRIDGVIPDLSHPFSGEVAVNGVQFRSTAGGPVVLGVDEVRAEKVRVEPEQDLIVVGNMEITKPIARVWRDKQGIHVGDILVRPPERKPAPGEPSLAAATQAPGQQQRQSPSPQQPAAPTRGEIRIDKLTVTGVDVVAEDKTSSPPLIVPLTGLDFEATDLSSRMMQEDRPVRFNVLVNAGKVPVVNPKTGVTEQRDLFSQVAASGRLAMYPKPNGWAKATVTGLELGALAGPAKQEGVTVGGGVFDANVDARFKPDGNIDTRSKFVFNDLKLSEAPSGPITRALKLPAPIDVVIAALEDPSGSITLPINVPIVNGKLRGVGPAAAEAAAGVIATAVATSPLKAGGMVAGLLGAGGQEKEKAQQAQERTLAFAPGDASLEGPATNTLAEVVAMMRKDPNTEVTVRHTLGPDDLAIVSQRVNPPASDAVSLAERIRARKAELLRLRQEAVGRARGQLAAGDESSSAVTLESLRAIDTEIASSDDALDQLYDLVRPGAERQAPRRTRAGCVDLAQQRMDGVQAVLMAANLPNAKERIHMAPARFETPAENAQPRGGNIKLSVVSRGKR